MQGILWLLVLQCDTVSSKHLSPPIIMECGTIMIQTKTIAVVVMAIAIGTIGITTTIMSSATAQSTNPPNGGSSPIDCNSRGLIAGCSPGQHINSNDPGGANILGSPFLPQTGGATQGSGDPHGSNVCSPPTGDPHASPTFSPGVHVGPSGVPFVC